MTMNQSKFTLEHQAVTFGVNYSSDLADHAAAWALMSVSESQLDPIQSRSADFEYRLLYLLDPALRVRFLVKLDFQDKRSVISALQVHHLLKLDFQDKRSVVPALQVRYLVKHDFQVKRSVVSALQVLHLVNFDLQDQRSVVPHSSYAPGDLPDELRLPGPLPGEFRPPGRGLGSSCSVQ
ncbi:uncharacterized protein [Neodiprion pinetum]|uniref:uncharacterized protein n=1 Tax=Neodiprion pinetum TaxID=441929 RepID=UPI00371EE70E